MKYEHTSVYVVTVDGRVRVPYPQIVPSKRQAARLVAQAFGQKWHGTAKIVVPELNTAVTVQV